MPAYRSCLLLWSMTVYVQDWLSDWPSTLLSVHYVHCLAASFVICLSYWVSGVSLCRCSLCLFCLPECLSNYLSGSVYLYVNHFVLCWSAIFSLLFFSVSLFVFILLSVNICLSILYHVCCASVQLRGLFTVPNERTGKDTLYWHWLRVCGMHNMYVKQSVCLLGHLFVCLFSCYSIYQSLYLSGSNCPFRIISIYP